MMNSRPISIMAFPRQGDSYTECFYPAVESLGVTVREGIFAGRWLVANLRNVDFIHLHWPSFFYNHSRRIKCLRNYALFLFLLVLARLRGAQLIWTMHNLYPHDQCVIPQLDKITRRLLVNFSARLFVHGPSAAEQVREEFPSSGGHLVVIDHGHWVGYYPNTISRAAARTKLGLEQEKFVFLFIGLCKPYKNLEALISALTQLPPRAHLVIAGRFASNEYQARIQAVVNAAADRVSFYPGFVPNEDLQIYLRACDAVVAPYKEILTSGTAMLAITFGRPAVVPRMGFLRDAITDVCGRLYSPSQTDGLLGAMESSMVAHFDEKTIMALALKHDWDKSAQAFVNGLR